MILVLSRLWLQEGFQCFEPQGQLLRCRSYGLKKVFDINFRVQ